MMVEIRFRVEFEQLLDEEEEIYAFRELLHRRV